MSDREAALIEFLSHAGWSDAKRGPLAGDASTRRYERLHRGNEVAVLMDAPPGEEEPACPPDADEATRRALGYNALARLAGPNQHPFVAIAEYLNARGLNAPSIMAADLKQGFLLIEDLGDEIFNRVINGGADPEPLYAAAIDAMVELHKEPAPRSLPLSAGTTIPLLDYDAVALTEEVKLLTQWYIPAAQDAPVDAGLEEEFTELWRSLLASLEDMTEVLILRDYHADNLLWLPDREGLARVGILDFQDGLRGHRAYDLVSLLEDARRDVDPALAARMLDRYVAAQKPGFDEDAFRRGYAILGLQRNTKILGIFARLWKRDGKPQYPEYMPRLWRYMDGDLAHPNVAPIKAWFDKAIPPEWRGDFLAQKARKEKA